MSEYTTQDTQGALDHVERLILTMTGMSLKTPGLERLRAFLFRRATIHHFETMSDYALWLSGLGPQDDEVIALVDLVTNGLTAFWREPGQLEAIRHLFRTWDEAQMGVMSVWCAGCSSGEEVYTLRMLALEESANVVILGTDINALALSEAREGVFSPWSLRRLDVARQGHYFRRNGERFVLDDLLRHKVYFRLHNMLAPPPRPPAERGWDLIVCRNALIYLTPEAGAKVLEHFAEALAPEGVLCLGISEQIREAEDLFVPQQLGDGTVYRRVLDAHWSDLSEHSSPEILAAVGQDESIDVLLDRAMTLVDRGATQQAVHTVERLVAQDPFLPDAHYVLAMLYEEEHAHLLCRHALERAVFLKPDQALALFRLGVYWERQEQHLKSAKHYKQAAKALRLEEGVIFENTTIARRYELSPVGRAQLLQECESGYRRVRALAR